MKKYIALLLLLANSVSLNAVETLKEATASVGTALKTEEQELVQDIVNRAGSLGGAVEEAVVPEVSRLKSLSTGALYVGLMMLPFVALEQVRERARAKANDKNATEKEKQEAEKLAQAAQNAIEQKQAAVQDAAAAS